MSYVADRVRETSTTTGTGTFSLAGTALGYQSFVDAVGTGAFVYYCITNRSASEWEIGTGTVTDGTPDTLSRTTVIASSNSGSAVTFTAGTKDVFLTDPAGRRGIGSSGYEINTAGVGSPNLIDAREAGTIYSNFGATALNYHTLPAATAGRGPFTFMVEDTDGIRVVAGTNDTIRIAASASAGSGRIDSTTIGDSVTLYCATATKWVAIAVVGAGWSAT